MDIMKMNRKNRRTVKPGIWRCFYGGGDVTSIGSVKMRGDLDFDDAVLPKNLPAPTLDGHAARKKYVDDAVAASLAVLGSKRVCRMSRTTTQSIGAGGGVITFTVEDFDYGNMVDIAGQPTRITIPQSGTYVFYFNFESNVTSVGVGMRKNGAGGDFINHQYNYLASTGGFAGAHACGSFGPIDLVAGDYLQLSATSSNGTGAVDVGPMGVSLCYFGAALIASNAVGGGDLKSDGTVPMLAAFDNGGFTPKNLAAPVADNDAARKKYVDDAIAAAVATFGVAPYKKAVARRTTGNVGLGALADIGGLTVTFTALGGECEMKFSGSLSTNAVISGTLVFDIDGGAVTRTFQLLTCVVGAGSDSFSAFMATVICPISLSAGVHTVKIRMSGVNATLIATDANHPASLVVDYQ